MTVAEEGLHLFLEPVLKDFPLSSELGKQIADGITRKYLAPPVQDAGIVLRRAVTADKAGFYLRFVSISYL